jgi:hypothetical protein
VLQGTRRNWARGVVESPQLLPRKSTVCPQPVSEVVTVARHSGRRRRTPHAALGGIPKYVKFHLTPTGKLGQVWLDILVLHPRTIRALARRSKHRLYERNKDLPPSHPPLGELHSSSSRSSMVSEASGQLRGHYWQRRRHAYRLPRRTVPWGYQHVSCSLELALLFRDVSVPVQSELTCLCHSDQRVQPCSSVPLQHRHCMRWYKARRRSPWFVNQEDCSICD